MEVTKELIEKWKGAHKFVYKATIDGTDYYYRTLTRDDYMEIQMKVAQEMPNFDNELEVVKTCLLAPTLDDETLSTKAGLGSVLSERIMLRSGFQQVEEEEL